MAPSRYPQRGELPSAAGEIAPEHRRALRTPCGPPGRRRFAPPCGIPNPREPSPGGGERFRPGDRPTQAHDIGVQVSVSRRDERNRGPVTDTAVGPAAVHSWLPAEGASRKMNFRSNNETSQPAAFTRRARCRRARSGEGAAIRADVHMAATSVWRGKRSSRAADRARDRRSGGRGIGGNDTLRACPLRRSSRRAVYRGSRSGDVCRR